MNRVNAAPGTGLAGVVYTAPAGWARDDSQPNQVLFSSPDNQSSLLLVAGARPKGDLPAIFLRVVGASLGNSMAYASGPVLSTKSPEGFDVLEQIIAWKDAANQDSHAAHIVIDAKTQLLIVRLLSRSDEGLKAQQDLLGNFLKDLHLGEGEAPPRPVTKLKSNEVDPTAVAREEAARRKPGIVQGNLYDTSGGRLRLPGVTSGVHIWGFSADGKRVFFDATVDANGHYEISVPHGLYVCTAWAKFTLGGQTLLEYLDALDQKPTQVEDDSTPGIVKDFGLKLTGPVLGGNPNDFSGYHGGGLFITDGGNWKEPIFGALDRRFPAGSYVQVILVPRTPLMDGSKGQTLTLRCEFDRMKTGHTLPNIPLALYTLSTEIITPDGQHRPCKVAQLPDTNYAPTLQLGFKPQDGERNARPEIPNILVDVA